MAEVLITLGVIGVVAAMTIPNLITAHQKKVTVTKLQKAISVLNQAYRLAYDDVGEATAEEAASMGNEAYFKKYWAPYLKTAQICTTYANCGYTSERPFKRYNGQPNDNGDGTIVVNQNRVTFYTADGFLYIMFIRSWTAEGDVPNSSIIIDINGAKQPNTAGKDVFYLTRVVDDVKGGIILPRFYDSTDDEVNIECSKDNLGRSCAEKIKRAGWQIDKSYPW